MAAAGGHIGVVEHVAEDLVGRLGHRRGGVGVKRHARQSLHLVESPDVAVLGFEAGSRMYRVDGAVKKRYPAAEVVPRVIGLVLAVEAVPGGRVVEAFRGVDVLVGVYGDPYAVAVQGYLEEFGGAVGPGEAFCFHRGVDSRHSLSHLDLGPGDHYVHVVGGVYMPERQASVIGVGALGELTPEGDVGLVKLQGCTQWPPP